MSIEIKVPALPESVSDATLVAWHKKAGDSIARDENLVDLETDKVVLEVPAPASGRLKEIRVKDGATVTAGDVLAILEEGEGKAPAAAGNGADDEASRGGEQDGSPGGGAGGGEGKAKPEPTPSSRRKTAKTPERPGSRECAQARARRCAACSTSTISKRRS